MLKIIVKEAEKKHYKHLKKIKNVLDYVSQSISSQPCILNTILYMTVKDWMQN